MTILEDIMNLLRDGELTSLEIASELDIPKSNCSAYLNTLYNDGRIERTNDKRPFKYKMAMTTKEILKQLYEFASDKNKCELKNLVILDIDFLEKVERRIYK